MPPRPGVDRGPGGAAPYVGGMSAQGLWEAAEGVHAVVYFDRGIRRAIRAAGAPGFWPGYFGTRLAPLRTADPALATSVLYSFAPAMVAEHLPDPADGAAWDGARRAAVRTRCAGLGPPAAAWAEAATLARRLLDAADPGARPLFAAHAGLPWPDDPYEAAWHATTLLREHRGDGHLHVLAGEGLTGAEAMVLALRWRGHTSPDGAAAESRGWTEAELAAAWAGLADRGWADGDRALTDTGRRARQAIEDATDARAVPRGVVDEAVAAATAALAPLARLTVAAVPRHNPIGIRGCAPG